MCRVSDIPDEEILDAIRQRPTTGKTPDEALSQKYPFRVILRKMEQMYKRGLLDFGVSLRTAWIVPQPLSPEPPPPTDRPPYPDLINNGVVVGQLTPDEMQKTAAPEKGTA